MRARKSSLRLVSWVEVASIRCGHRVCAISHSRWNSSDSIAETRRIAANFVERRRSG